MPVVRGAALDDVAVSRGKLAQIADRRGDLDDAREHLEAAFLTELIRRDPKWTERLDENRREREGLPTAPAPTPARSCCPFGRR
jgi:hypothetical protein